MLRRRPTRRRQRRVTLEDRRARERQRYERRRRRCDHMVIDDDDLDGSSGGDEADRIIFNREIATAAIETTEGQETCRESVNLVTPLHAETLQQGLQDFRDHMFAGSRRSPCAVCDRLTLVRRYHVLSASEIPSEQFLRADEALRKQDRVMAAFRGYAGDTARDLDNLVLSASRLHTTS